MANFPIVIFAYNRPIHLSRMLNSLSICEDLEKHKIYIFCDGPKNKKDIFQINKIKTILKNKKIKFKKKIFRKKNIGLAENIINGVSEILKKNKACIVLEDDLIFGKYAIFFVNYYLNKFVLNKKIGSVSSHSYLHDFKKYKRYGSYFTKRHCSWCWGTWSRVWRKIEWNNIDYEKHFKNKIKQKNFSLAGNDLNLLLWAQSKNIINSWAIRFNFYCFLNNLKSIQSRYTIVSNTGNDFSGTHELYRFRKKYDLNDDKLSRKNLINKKILSDKKSDLFIRKTHRESYRLKLKKFFFY